MFLTIHQIMHGPALPRGSSSAPFAGCHGSHHGMLARRRRPSPPQPARPSPARAHCAAQLAHLIQGSSRRPPRSRASPAGHSAIHRVRVALGGTTRRRRRSWPSSLPASSPGSPLPPAGATVASAPPVHFRRRSPTAGSLHHAHVGRPSKSPWTPGWLLQRCRGKEQSAAAGLGRCRRRRRGGG